MYIKTRKADTEVRAVSTHDGHKHVYRIDRTGREVPNAAGRDLLANYPELIEATRPVAAKSDNDPPLPGQQPSKGPPNSTTNQQPPKPPSYNPATPS